MCLLLFDVVLLIFNENGLVCSVFKVCLWIVLVKLWVILYVVLVLFMFRFCKVFLFFVSFLVKLIRIGVMVMGSDCLVSVFNL